MQPCKRNLNPLFFQYFDGVMNELDVLIIGGYYGEGRRRGLISSFLLAVAKSPEIPGKFVLKVLIFVYISYKLY